MDSPDECELGLTERSQAPRILLIDGRQLVRSAFQHMLCGFPLFANVTTCARTDVALSILGTAAVDLVLCELDARPVSGPEFARQWKGRDTTPVGLLTETDNEQQIREAIQSGAAGVLTTDALGGEFMAGVSAMLNGHFVMSAKLARRALDPRHRDDRDAAIMAFHRLSAAEREILLLLGQGTPIDAIAAGRGTTKKTVRNHVANVYRKLALRRRADVILWVARMGLTEPPAVGHDPLTGEGAPA